MTADISRGTGGVDEGYLGCSYQLKLLELFSYRSLKNKVNFQLNAKDDRAGKFDHVIYQYKSNVYRLIQAKHKKSPKPITVDTLYEDKNYCLHLFFYSYLKIAKNCLNAEELLFCTNNYFEEVDPGSDTIELKCNQKDKLYLKKFVPEDMIFGSLGFHYKLDQSVEANFIALRNNFLTKELIAYLFTENAEITEVLAMNHEYLFENLLDKNSFKFVENFKDGAELEDFRDAFERNFGIFSATKVKDPKNVLKLLKDNLWDEIMNVDFHEKIEKLFQNSSDQTEIEANQKEIDEKIRSFIEKVTFLVNLKEEEIEAQLGFKENEDSEVNSSIRQGFKEMIGTWTTSKSKKILNFNKVKTFFERYHNNLSMQFMKTTKYQNANQNIQLEFNESCKVFYKSLTENPNQLLWVHSNPGELFLTSAKINQNNNNMLLIKNGMSDEELKNGLNVFGSQEHQICYVEVTDTDDIEFIQKFIKIIQENSDKKIVVISEELETSEDFLLIEDEVTLCKHLSANSFNQILNKVIGFQDREVKIKDLLQGYDLLSTKLLDAWNLREVGEELELPKNVEELKLCVPRKLIQHRYVKKEFLENLNGDVTVETEDEFNQLKDSVSNVHWLVKEDEEKIKWMKTHGSIENLKNHLDLNNSVKVLEENLVESPEKLVILSNATGMGKTTMISRLARNLADKFVNHWIIFIDLNELTQELRVMASDSFDFDSFVPEILAKNIVGLTEQFEIDVFLYHLENSANVHIFLDSFDEIAADYGTVVINMIKVLLKYSIKQIYLCTRDECSDGLENEFSQLKYSLLPFDKVDQKSYMVRVWKDKSGNRDMELTAINALRIVNNSMKTTDQQLTGIPLILKMIADFYGDNLSQLDNEDYSFNIYQLYENFIDRLLTISLIDEPNLDGTLPKIKRLIIRVKTKLQRLLQQNAMKLFFNQEVLKKIQFKERKITEEDDDYLVSSGLIYRTTPEQYEYKFNHQSYIEHLVAQYMDVHFAEELVAEFLLEEILEKNQFQMIRMFIDRFIIQKCFQENVDVYSKLNAEKVEKDILGKLYHLALNEKNLQIVKFLMISALNDTSSTPFLFRYYEDFDDLMNLFGEIHESVDKEVVKKLILFKKVDDVRIYLMSAIRNGKNYMKLLDLMNEYCGKDKEFIREVYQSRDQNGESFLHLLVEFFDENLFDSFLNEFAKLREIIGAEDLEVLVSAKTKTYENFFCYFRKYSANENSLRKIWMILKDLFSEDVEFLKYLVLHCSGDESDSNWIVGVLGAEWNNLSLLSQNQKSVRDRYLPFMMDPDDIPSDGVLGAVGNRKSAYMMDPDDLPCDEEKKKELYERLLKHRKGKIDREEED